MHAVLLRFGADLSTTREARVWMQRVTKKHVLPRLPRVRQSLLSKMLLKPDGSRVPIRACHLKRQGLSTAAAKSESPKSLRAWGWYLVVVAGLEPATSAL